MDPLSIQVNDSVGLIVEDVGLLDRRFAGGEVRVVEEKGQHRVLADGVDLVLRTICGDGGLLLSFGGRSTKGVFHRSIFGAKMVLKGGIEGVLGLTMYGIGRGLTEGFKIYNPVGLGRAQPPAVEPAIKYPDEPTEDASRSLASFTNPYVADGVEKIYPYTLFLLIKTQGRYYSLLALSDREASAYIDKGLILKVGINYPSPQIGSNTVLAVGYDRQPYGSIRKMVELLSEHSLVKLRWAKRRPEVIDHLGWCSWNALQKEDLSHDRIVGIVGGLRGRGVPVKWVIVDDGWEGVEGGAQAGLEPDPRKFPGGFEALTRELRGLGVEQVGLWHTINIYWRGAHRRFFEELGAPSTVDYNTGFHIPPGDLLGALGFYERFYGWVKSKGFDFVKTDNQVSLRHAYTGRPDLSPRNLKMAHELAALGNGLWILNCMSMVPESYSYYFESNVMRVSNDYIPFWGGSAKLHVYWCFYNSVLFGSIAIPDFDMWMSYDPSAKLYAVASVLSGGPVYITDRDPERTDVGLLRRLVLPGGRLVGVDEPALPTEDTLFHDPYNEPRLLRVAGRAGHAFVVGLFNLYRERARIRDTVDLARLGVELGDQKYVVYGVYGGMRGVFDQSGRVDVELDNGDAEILVLAPLKENKSVVGLKEYLVPPAAVVARHVCGDWCVEPKAPGTLLYYKDNALVEVEVTKQTIKI